MNDLISVIMPVYNDTVFLAEAINSIISQTYQNLELIIIDDGSERLIKDIVDNFSDRRIRYIYQQNKGISIALNNGILIAKGNYIAIMHSDDISLPKRLETQYNFITQKGYDLIGGQAERIDDKGNKLGIIKKPILSKYVKEYLMYSSALIHPLFFGKTEVFKNLLYRDHFAPVEDYDFLQRAVNKNYILGNVPEILLYYRIRQNSLSSSNYYKNIKSSFCIAEFGKNPNKIFNKSYLLNFISKKKKYKSVYFNKLYKLFSEYNIKLNESKKLLKLFQIIKIGILSLLHKDLFKFILNGYKIKKILKIDESLYKKKNILYLISGLDYGGAEFLLLETALHLKDSFSSQFIIYLKGTGKLAFQSKYKDLNIKGINSKQLGLRKTIKDLKSFIQKNNIEIVHAHLSYANLIAKLVSLQIRNIRYYVTYHNIDKRLKSKSISVMFYNTLDSVLTNFSKQHSSIAISDVVCKYHKHVKKIRSKKIAIIKNGVFFGADNAEPRFKDFIHSKLKVLTIGRLIPGKNIIEQLEIILRLSKHIPHVSLTILGDGPEKQKIQDALRSLAINNIVNIENETTDVRKYYESHDLYLSSSISEGLGLTILEAISYGLVVVARKSGGSSEIITDNETGFLYNSIDEAIEKILSIYNEKYQLSIIRKNAFKEFKEIFHPTVYLKKLKQEYGIL